MKEKMTRLSALFLTLVLALSLLAVPAMAADMKNYEENPVFSIMAINDEEAYAVTAFLARDPKTGGVFLLGPRVVASLAQEGFDLYLCSESYEYFEQPQVLGSYGSLSFLSAPGLENAYPFDLSEQAVASMDELRGLWVGYDESLILYSDGFILNDDWQKQSDGSYIADYLSYEVLADLTVLGAMILSSEDEVVGYFSASSDSEVMLIPLQAGDLPVKYAINAESIDAEKKPDEPAEVEPDEPVEAEPAEPAEAEPQPEETPAPSKTKDAPQAEAEPEAEPEAEAEPESAEETPSKGGSTVIYWLVGIAALVVVGYFVWRANTKKKPEQPDEGTVMLEKDFPLPPQPQPQPQPQPFARFAVRDLAGRVTVCDASEKLHFGRGSGCEVHFSAEDTSISAHHCTISRQNGELYLTDTGSTNGTFFNENERLKPYTPYRIRKGMAFFLSNPSHTYVVTEDEI